MRTYVVEYEKVDVWCVEVEAPNKREARQMVLDGDFDVERSFFSHYGGDGRVLSVDRSDD